MAWLSMAWLLIGLMSYASHRKQAFQTTPLFIIFSKVSRETLQEGLVIQIWWYRYKCWLWCSCVCFLDHIFWSRHIADNCCSILNAISVSGGAQEERLLKLIAVSMWQNQSVWLTWKVWLDKLYVTRGAEWKNLWKSQVNKIWRQRGSKVFAAILRRRCFSGNNLKWWI